MLTILTLAYAFLMASQITPKRHYLVVRPLTTEGKPLIGADVYAFLVVPGKGSVFLKAGTTGLNGKALIEVSLDKVRKLINITKDKMTKIIYSPTILVVAVYKDFIGFTSYPVADFDVTKSEVIFKERECLDIILKKYNIPKVEPLIPRLVPTLVSSHTQWCRVELVHLNLTGDSSAELIASIDSYIELYMGITGTVTGIKPMTLGYVMMRVPIDSPRSISKSVTGPDELTLSVNIKVIWEEWEYPSGFHEHRFFITDIDFSSLSFERGDEVVLYENNWRVEEIRDSLTLSLNKNYSLNVILPKSLITEVAKKALVSLTPPEYELGFKLIMYSGLRMELKIEVLTGPRMLYIYHTWLGNTLTIRV